MSTLSASVVEERVAVIGLGYVGLPVALAAARTFSDTIGFDIDAAKIDRLRRGIDRSGEVESAVLQASSLKMTADPAALNGTTFFIVAVPTPVDRDHRPDLSPLIGASEIVGKALKPGGTVVYESTVYPGVTEEICGPLLAKISGLKQGVDFKLGYSPERINPGDREHTLEKIVKVVSGEDGETLDRVAAVYGAFVSAGIHRAPTIKVAEAAKVIENTQRDLNIALMNELALVFDRLDIDTNDVLAAAATKWNFLRFRPGLVGGHCIGVDPYYLTTKAEQVGYLPQVILAGRRINDNMGIYLAQRLVKMLANGDRRIKGARVGILGITFKENVSDLRNSRVPDIVRELRQFGIEPLVHDSLASASDAMHEYGIELCPFEKLSDLDALMLCVSHQPYLTMPVQALCRGLNEGGVLIDVKAALAKEALAPAALGKKIHFWRL